jgi:hypothetical protein
MGASCRAYGGGGLRPVLHPPGYRHAEVTAGRGGGALAGRLTVRAWAIAILAMRSPAWGSTSAPGLEPRQGWRPDCVTGRGISNGSDMMPLLVLLRGTMGAGKTAVARGVAALGTTVAVIEIDEIKCRKYGTTARCCPESDFPEAGCEAKKEMDRGYNAIVVEPLCEQSHVELVLRAAGVNISSPNVIYIWLECALDTAFQRKDRQFSQDEIIQQYNRYPSRYRHPREFVINTDQRYVEEVAQQVLALLERHSSG